MRGTVFPIVIIFLFVCAGVDCIITKEWLKAWFYIFSALINVTVLYM